MKKQRTKLYQRVLALALALTLCLGMAPMAAFAVTTTCGECKWTGGAHSPDCSFNTSAPKDESAKCEHSYNENGQCTNCGESKYEKPVEPKPCEHEYVDGLYCKYCGEMDPSHTHKFDADGKCVCGSQHTHSWSYTADFSNYGKHVASCSCGAREEQACTFDETTYLGKRCSLCRYWQIYNDKCQHVWGRWNPNGDGMHTHTCETCGEEGKEECKLAATDDSSAVVCKDCGWIKYNDGKPSEGSGSNECADGKHEYSTGGYPVTDHSHKRLCKNCPHEEAEECKWSIYKDENGKLEAHYCNICGNQKSIRDDGDNQYCTNTDKGHDWALVKDVISEDGQSVITTIQCSYCGVTRITNICNSPSKVTVHYVYKNGGTAHPDKSQAVIKGTAYTIVSPVIDGYEYDQEVVSGVCNDGKGLEVTVTYTKVEKYTLTIKYHFVDDCNMKGQEVAPDYTAQLKPFEEYSVESPKAPLGYALEKDKATVTGKMGERDTNETVKYAPIPYTWTIYYVDEQGNKLAEDTVTHYNVENVKALTIPEVPSIKGYKVKSNDVTLPASDVLGDVEGKVVYEPVTYTWTIYYEDEQGEELFEKNAAEFDVTKTLDSVESPAKKGYSASHAVVERPTDKAEDQSFTVVYSLSTDFSLTVLHRYVGLNGEADHEVTEELGKFAIGQQYTTNARNENGYTLSAVPANASGIFGEEDVVVVYVYNANRRPVVPPSVIVTVTPTPTPTPTPDPDIDIEDPDVPQGPGPVVPTPTPDPDVDIEDPDVPQGPGPVVPTPAPDPDVDIEDPDVPLGPGTEEAEPETKPSTPDVDEEIPDTDVPLADVPKTGDSTRLWLTLAMLSAAGLAVIEVIRRKEGKEA